VNREDQPVKLLAFDRQLFPTGRREGVVAGATVVCGRAPLGFDLPSQQEALQGGIERAFTDL
jgi:hypothetical protein